MMTDAEMLKRLREIPECEFDDAVWARIKLTNPGAENWAAYQIIGTDQMLIFGYDGDLSVQEIRAVYQRYVDGLPTVGQLQ